jgi:hypothetical protein
MRERSRPRHADVRFESLADIPSNHDVRSTPGRGIR